MKAFKVLIWTSGVLVVLVLGAAVGLVTWVDINDYKAEIAAQVKQHTGRDLQVRGDIELAFYPWLGVKTGPLEFANREGFGSAPMLTVEQTSIKIKLVPLLKKRVEIDTVVLTAPQINLSRKADGTANWDDLTAKAQRHGGSLAGGGKPLPDAALAAGLVVQGVSVKDGRVSWDDLSNERSVTLKALNLNTGKLEPGKPLNIDVSFEIESSALPKPASIRATSTARVTENPKSISLENTELHVAIKSADGNQPNTSVKIPALGFDLSGQSLQIPMMTLTQDDFVLSASMNGGAVLAGIPAMTLSGDVDAQVGDVAEFLKRNNFGNESLSNLSAYLVQSADLRFHFKLDGYHLKLLDLTVKSRKGQGEQLLLEREDIDIPLDTDGRFDTPAVAHVLNRALRAHVEKRLSQWLLEQIVPPPTVADADDASVDLSKAVKKTLKKKLLEALD